LHQADLLPDHSTFPADPPNRGVTISHDLMLHQARPTWAALPSPRPATTLLRVPARPRKPAKRVAPVPRKPAPVCPACAGRRQAGPGLPPGHSPRRRCPLHPLRGAQPRR
jgi:hypothetical protein